MNNDLIDILITDLDPTRDLSDRTLYELVPEDHLMARVLAAIEQPALASARTPIWRRASLRLSAVAAAAVLVVSGAVAFLGSSPPPLTGGFALGAVHPSWVEYSTSPSAVVNYGTETQSMAAALISHGRISSTLHLNGLTIAPPPSSTKPRVSAAQMASELWSAASLKGQTEVAFGYGDITLNVAQDGASRLDRVPVWLAIATSKPCSSASACSAATIASLPLTVVVSGYGLPNREATTGTPIAFTYQTKGANSATKPRLLPAIEQVSISWLQDGPVANGNLHITAAPVPCGALDGYSLVTNVRGTTLTVKGLIPVSTIGDYCALSMTGNKVIPLRGASAGVTTFHHAPTGPMRATT